MRFERANCLLATTYANNLAELIGPVKTCCICDRTKQEFVCVNNDTSQRWHFLSYGINQNPTSSIRFTQY